VDASPAAVVAIEANLEDKPQRNRLGFRFSGGTILLRTLWNATLSFPYPVPFQLLGDNAKGWLQTDFITPRLRLSRHEFSKVLYIVTSMLYMYVYIRMLGYRLLRMRVRGNKGSLFVLAPEPEPDDAELEALLQPPPPPLPLVDAATLTKGPVLICPAQFGTKASNPKPPTLNPQP
jgi:hypothetical protein